MAELLLGVQGAHVFVSSVGLFFVLCGEIQWKSHLPATDSKGKRREITEKNAFG